MGKSLDKLMVDKEGKFELKFALELADQMIERI